MDRILLNPWVSRAGNAAFLIAAGLFLWGFVSGLDPVLLVGVVALVTGVLLIAAPRARRWQLSRADDLDSRLRDFQRTGVGLLKGSSNDHIYAGSVGLWWPTSGAREIMHAWTVDLRVLIDEAIPEHSLSFTKLPTDFWPERATRKEMCELIENDLRVLAEIIKSR